MLEYITTGESHGSCLVAVVQGFPAGVHLNVDAINHQLARRQQGYGRGGRMTIERDTVRIVAGIRKGETTGAPISMVIDNKDYSIDRLPPVYCPRPGHADLAGVVKYGRNDCRDILERASARETAARVAVGAVMRQLLHYFDIAVLSHVISIGMVNIKKTVRSIADITAACAGSQLQVIDPDAEKKMIRAIDRACRTGDTLGGMIEIIAEGVPIGLGSCMRWEERIDARFAYALMSIPAIKGVECGLGFAAARLPGSRVHDAIYYDARRKKNCGFYRKTNNAGGCEGGMTNGEPLVKRCAMKPIATLVNPLPSVDLRTGKPAQASVERSDVCAVSAAGVVCEAVVSFELARALIQHCGGDSLVQMRSQYTKYINSPVVG